VFSRSLAESTTAFSRKHLVFANGFKRVHEMAEMRPPWNLTENDLDNIRSASGFQQSMTFHVTQGRLGNLFLLCLIYGIAWATAIVADGRPGFDLNKDDNSPLPDRDDVNFTEFLAVRSF